jgi:hypothetical protein
MRGLALLTLLPVLAGCDEAAFVAAFVGERFTEDPTEAHVRAHASHDLGCSVSPFDIDCNVKFCNLGTCERVCGVEACGAARGYWCREPPRVASVTCR